MSFKAKNLTYDMEEPAFLRRLRQGQSGGGDHQQRHIAPRNRKRPTDDDEDAPTYVMEGGSETISAEEFNAMNAPKKDVEGSSEELEGGSKSEGEKTKESSLQGEGGVVDPTTVLASSKKEKILEVGTKTTKRKAVKMVGRDDDDAEEDGLGKEEVAPSEKKKKIGAKTKGKQKVKLSFQNED